MLVTRDVPPPPFIVAVGISAVSDEFMMEFWREIISKAPENDGTFSGRRKVPHVFIRFNPDAYTDSNGIKHKSCWGKTPKTYEPRVAPK